MERLVTNPNWVWCEGMRVVPKEGSNPSLVPHRLTCHHLGPLPGWEVDLEDPLTLGFLLDLAWNHVRGIFHLNLMASREFLEDPFYLWVHPVESGGIHGGKHIQGHSLTVLLAELLVWIWEEGPQALEEKKKVREKKARVQEEKVTKPSEPAAPVPAPVPSEPISPEPSSQPQSAVPTSASPKKFKLVLKPRTQSPQPPANPQSITDLFNLGDDK